MKSNTPLSKQELAILTILSNLSENEYATASYLSNKVKMSEGTIRNMINDLNTNILKDTALIYSKPNHGYKITIYRQIQFNSIIQSELKHIPVEFQIIHHLFKKQNEFISIEMIADQLYLSKQSVFLKIDSVSSILAHYQISLERLSGYGIRLIAKESEIRQLLSKNIAYFYTDYEVAISKISSCLSICINNNLYRSLSDVCFNDCINLIYVLLSRLKEGKLIEYISMEDSQKINHLLDFTRQLASLLHNIFEITIPDREISYLSSQLSGKVTFSEISENISAEYVEFSKHTIQNIKQSFNIDFTNNFDLLISLSIHLSMLIQRLRHHTFNPNPLLPFIKENYPLAYAMAHQITTDLFDTYGTKTIDEEIGYLALIIELALEASKSQSEQKSILLVCASGTSTANLLKYKLINLFHQHIKVIHVCSLQTLYSFKMASYDYIFTTVDIAEAMPIPIIKISVFLEDIELKNIEQSIKQLSTQEVEQFFSFNLFYPHLVSTSKEAVLMEMCNHIKNSMPVPNDLYDLIWKREVLTSTAYGNKVAIPHSSKIILKHTKVAVGITKEPIDWGENKVQVIFMFLVGSEEGYLLKYLYRAIAKLVFDSRYINKLIRKKDYEFLMSKLMELSNDLMKED